MAVKDYPSNIVPDGEDWTLLSNTQTYTSDLNGVSQTAKLPGTKWKANVTYSSRTGREVRELRAFIASLEGQAGRFWFTPSDWEPLGVPSGVGKIAVSALAGATTISTKDWTTLETDELFVSGDYFEINGELKVVTQTVSADALGQADIQFTPPLRVDVVVDQVIRYTEPRCQMKLMNDSQASWALSAPVFYAMTCEFVEALDI